MSKGIDGEKNIPFRKYVFLDAPSSHVLVIVCLDLVIQD